MVKVIAEAFPSKLSTSKIPILMQIVVRAGFESGLSAARKHAARARASSDSMRK